MLIDCGSIGDGRRAYLGLRRIVRLGPALDLTVVVTHFHDDHYNGLLELAATARDRSSFGRVQMVQPALPRAAEVSEFVLRLFALEDFLGARTGLPDLDLAHRVSGLCRYGLRAEVLYRGQRFEAGGHEFDVLWPPRTLDATTTGVRHRVSKRLREANKFFDDLGDQLPGLAENREAARRGVDLGGWMAEEAPPASPDRLASGLNDDTAWYPNEDFDDDPLAFDEWESPEADSELIDLTGYPPDVRDRLRVAKRLFAHAANYMSLVFASRNRDFVSWGDAPIGLARSIARGDALPKGPDSPWRRGIALAPHHGSLGPTPTLGRPFICISQHGPRLGALWAAKHGRTAGGTVGQCTAVACLSTLESEDFELDV